MIFMKPKHTSFACLFLAVALSSFQAQAQYITTFAGSGYGAGSGTGGKGGDGGAAYAAELFNPTGVATYGYVNTYIADRGNHRVRRVDYNGLIYTHAGNGLTGYTWGNDTTAATATKLSDPYALAVDAGNNVYFSDYTNNVVYKVATNGKISTVAGNDTAGYTGDGGPAKNARLNHPMGIALDAANNLYIADALNNVIRKVNAVTGIITTVAGNGYGAGMSLGHGGYTGDNGQATAARLNYPEGIAVDATGNMYIADAQNNVIRKVNTANVITTLAGTGAAGFSGDGGMAAAATLMFPSSVAVDGPGSVYIADQGNNNVRKVTTDGKIATIAGIRSAGYNPGEHNALLSQLSAPTGVTVDGNGLVYIADQRNNVVRVLGPASIVNGVTTVGNNAAGLKVYPNPTRGSFTIDLPETSTGAEITVSDMTGKVVLTKTINDTKAQQVPVSLDHMAAGNYIVKVTSATGTLKEKIQVMQ